MLILRRVRATIGGNVQKTFEVTPEIEFLEPGTLGKEFEASIKAARFRRQARVLIRQITDLWLPCFAPITSAVCYARKSSKTRFATSAGRHHKDQFAEIMDNSIREAIRMQDDAGLKSITDGEFRRGSWFFGFVQAVDGLTIKDSLFDFRDASGGHATFQTAYVEANFAARAASPPTNLRSSKPTPATRRKSRCRRPVSSTSSGSTRPSTARSIRDMEEFWTDLIAVYREELTALAALGCRIRPAR